jgi:hypothetical protein
MLFGWFALGIWKRVFHRSGGYYWDLTKKATTFLVCDRLFDGVNFMVDCLLAACG